MKEAKKKIYSVCKGQLQRSIFFEKVDFPRKSTVLHVFARPAGPRHRQTIF